MDAQTQTIAKTTRNRVPSRSETIRAVGFMLAGFACYSFTDMMGKLLTKDFHPLQVAWSRQLGLVSAVCILLLFKGTVILRSNRPLLQFVRGLTVVVAASSFMASLAFVPLADATAVTFLAPFMVTIFAALLLGETIGLKRWAAVLIGFAGTMIIVRPGISAIHPAIFFSVVSAAAFALRQVLSRRLAGSDPMMTTIAFTALTAVIVLSLPLPFVWKTPEAWQLLMFLTVSCVAGLAEFFIIRALDLGEAAVLSPLQYTLIIWSTLWGFIVFAQLPDRWTLLGTVIVIGSGIYSLYKETRARS